MMKTNAIFSEDGSCRYLLSKQWGSKKEKILFIGLNPSHLKNGESNPTINRLVGFAKRWGFDGFYLCNLFSFCTPNPKELFSVQDPVGKDNDSYIVKYLSRSSICVLVYGNQGKRYERHNEILELIPQSYCIGVSKLKLPLHPLYLKYTNRPIPYAERNILNNSLNDIE